MALDVCPCRAGADRYRGMSRGAPNISGGSGPPADDGSVLRPDAPISIATSTALATLALYMGIAVTVIALVISRRDMTS